MIAIATGFVGFERFASCRDARDMLAEQGVAVDASTIHRRVCRSGSEIRKRAHGAQRRQGDRRNQRLAGAGRRNLARDSGILPVCPVGGIGRVIKDATVKRDRRDSHDPVPAHLAGFLTACNFARRLNTLSGLTPYEYVCSIRASEPDRFCADPIHQMPELDTQASCQGSCMASQVTQLGRIVVFCLRRASIWRTRAANSEGFS